jgi:hypothetical protein
VKDEAQVTAIGKCQRTLPITLGILGSSGQDESTEDNKPKDPGIHPNLRTGLQPRL